MQGKFFIGDCQYKEQQMRAITLLIFVVIEHAQTWFRCACICIYVCMYVCKSRQPSKPWREIGNNFYELVHVVRRGVLWYRLVVIFFLFSPLISSRLLLLFFKTINTERNYTQQPLYYYFCLSYVYKIRNLILFITVNDCLCCFFYFFHFVSTEYWKTYLLFLFFLLMYAPSL